MGESAPKADTDEMLGFLIHETSQALSQCYSSRMAPLGLTRPQVRVIIWADHQPGITQVELCERLSSSPMAMTGLLDRMENKNLIKRVEDPNDRRAKRIFLTDGAIALKPEMERLSEVLKAEVRMGLRPQEIEIAQKVLTVMKANALKLKERDQAPDETPDETLDEK